MTATQVMWVAGRTGSTNAALQQWYPALGALTDISAVFGSPRYVCQWDAQNRTALAHFTSAASAPGGANGSISTVFFTDPNSPTAVSATITTSNWENLAPFDGEEITGMVQWREQLFIVKETTLFVFYAVSVDSTGGASFIFRPIDLPSRVRKTANRGGENMVAGGDGVYLYCADGMYRTDGLTVQLVSRDITPLFDGTGDSSMLLPTSGDWMIGYGQNRVYLSYTASGSFRTLVYDTVLGEWLLWDLSAGSSALPTNVIEFVDTNNLPTVYVAAGSKVYSLSKSATDDGGTAIVSSYQSGFDPLVAPGQEKVVRQLLLSGTGTPTVSVFTDYGSTDANSAAVTLGTAPTPDEGLHRVAYSGRAFSFKFNKTSGAWTVTRIELDVREVRAAGLRRT